MAGRVAATLVRADGGESVLRGREGELRANSTTITEAGTSQKCRGLTRFWCTDGYAVCGYAEAAGTRKHIVVSVDEVGVSKTPGLRVTRRHRLMAAALARGDRAFRIESLARSSFLEA